MRVRARDASGDYTFGHGSANFLVNSPAAVAQKIETRFALWEGSWFLDLTSGTPWAQEVLGYGTSALYDMVIRARILGTDGVTAIQTYSSSLDQETRDLTVSGSVMTQFSKNPVPFGPVVL